MPCSIHACGSPSEPKRQTLCTSPHLQPRGKVAPLHQWLSTDVKVNTHPLFKNIDTNVNKNVPQNGESLLHATGGVTVTRH